VDVFAGFDIQGGGAAGSVYIEIPALLIAAQTDDSQQVYAGCYVTRRSNVPTGDSPTPDPNWRLYSLGGAGRRLQRGVGVAGATVYCVTVSAVAQEAEKTCLLMIRVASLLRPDRAPHVVQPSDPSGASRPAK
jgi:hypothetical protein